MEDQLLSVGIDLGTTTTQMVISKLTIKNMASDFTIPRIEIINKEILFRSEMMFTPLLSGTTIDVASIKSFLDQQYQKSGFDRAAIQVGAVIITGETARKENAKVVLEALSGYAGDFVVATAGPDLEGMIAAKGAGASYYAKANHTSVVNLDIGGGTTNLALFHHADLVDTGCYDIGGRLIKVDGHTKAITYISPKLTTIIKEENLPIYVGVTATKDLLSPLIDLLVANLEYAIGVNPVKPKHADLLITNKALTRKSLIAYVSFSGGVADCIDLEVSDPFIYGDIGILLGEKIRHSRLVTAKKIAPSTETIRATVVGAGSHTTEVSGSTITYCQKTLPLKNVPVIKLRLTDTKADERALATTILEKTAWYQYEGEDHLIALSFEGYKNPTFQEISQQAKAIVAGLQERIEKGHPIVVLIKEDNGKALGQSILSLVDRGTSVICLDGLAAFDGDYVDIGRPVANGMALPVIIKTLAFG